MNKSLSNTIIFAIGAAIGSLVTWKVIKTKYERVAQEEIDSVKAEYEKLSDRRRKEIEVYKRFNEANNAYDSEQNDKNSEETEYEPNEEDIVAYHNITRRYQTTESEHEEKNDEKGAKEDYVEAPVQNIDPPYVISPDMFGGIPGYSIQPLSYFVDGILADDWGVELDIEETIGEESLNHFGEYVDDTVYIRNERNEIDYEVTQDPRTYEDAMKATPSSRVNQ